MQVKQLIGRLAGEIVDMNYAEAQACIAQGTACLPEEEPTNIKGFRPAETEVPIEGEDTGGFPGSGPETPSPSSPADQASQPKTSSAAGESEGADGSESSASTAASEETDESSSPPPGRTVSSPPTKRGGTRRATRRASKAD